MGGVALQGVGRRRGWFPWRPGAPGDVEHPQLVRHVGRLRLQLPSKHVDVILHEGEDGDRRVCVRHINVEDPDVENMIN